jgi:hypothetical protein
VQDSCESETKKTGMGHLAYTSDRIVEKMKGILFRRKKKAEWNWNVLEARLKQQWTRCIAVSEGHPPKELWVNELLDLSARVLDKRNEAARHTASAHWLARGSAGITAGVATLTGGVLIGGISKLNAKIATYFGLAVAFAGLLAAGIAAARPDQSYSADLVRKAQLEQLWWDIRSYGITLLAEAKPNDFKNAVEAFAEREKNIMSAGATAAAT